MTGKKRSRHAERIGVRTKLPVRGSDIVCGEEKMVFSCRKNGRSD